MIAPQTHFGVYGAFVVEGALLAVRKTRGPYTGWLDLPGGAPEPGETLEQALRRELGEETGGEAEQLSACWREFNVHSVRDSAGRPIHFFHRGLWQEVHLRGVDFCRPGSEDVDGLDFVPIGRAMHLLGLTPGLRAVASSVGQPIQGR